MFQCFQLFLVTWLNLNTNDQMITYQLLLKELMTSRYLAQKTWLAVSDSALRYTLKQNILKESSHVLFPTFSSHCLERVMEKKLQYLVFVSFLLAIRYLLDLIAQLWLSGMLIQSHVLDCFR